MKSPKQGDLYQLGTHLLYCGDSEDARSIKPLFLRANPNLCCTDPPYGVNYDADWRKKVSGSNQHHASGKVMNDSKADWQKAYRLFPGNIVYTWCASWFLSTTQHALEICGFEIKALIIWAKNQGFLDRAHYHFLHDPCWYAVRKGEQAHWRGGHSQTTLWKIKKEANFTNHSTQKPLECMARPIRNHTLPGEWVYDPFVGSGTTLIAAELLKRKCLAVELNPEYVAMTILRWEILTGLKAHKK